MTESLNELLDQIRTPEPTPSPVDAYVTEEELFHRKNPEVMFVIGWTAQLKLMGRADPWCCCIPGILELAESALDALRVGFEEGRCSLHVYLFPRYHSCIISIKW